MFRNEKTTECRKVKRNKIPILFVNNQVDFFFRTIIIVGVTIDKSDSYKSTQVVNKLVTNELIYKDINL